MNGYDFDKTILKGNSMCRFAFFCAIRLPYLFLFTPVLLIGVLLYGLRIISKNRYLHMISLFVALVPRTERYVVKFWDRHFKFIKQWYLAQKRSDDIIISASPQFLVEEACRRLGVRCLATDLNPSSAKLTGVHCYGEEKVQAYKEVFGDAPLSTYYSDSMSDTPMFKLAERGYFVRGNKVKLLYEHGVKVAR